MRTDLYAMKKFTSHEKTVQSGSASVNYYVSGPDDSAVPTVCLIASTGRGPTDFLHLAAALAAKGIRAVMPWPRGIGRSTGSIADIDFHDLAADAAAALAAEKQEGGSYAVGHAYGCWIARTLSHDHPDLVDGIVLLAAGGGKWPESLSLDINIAMDESDSEANRLSALQRAFFAPGNDPQAWLQGWNPELVQMQRAARARTDKNSWWSGGNVPILDIVGLQDPFRPETDKQFYVKEFAPRVTLKTVDGASHALPDEKPEETATLMHDWINVQQQRVVQ